MCRCELLIDYIYLNYLEPRWLAFICTKLSEHPIYKDITLEKKIHLVLLYEENIFFNIVITVKNVCP